MLWLVIINMAENKLVSIIIPALNEEELLEKTLLSLKRQNYHPVEIIVVDNGSEDQTKEIAKKYTDKVFPFQKRGASRARNFGAKMAKGEYLIFLDADTRMNENAVKNTVKYLERGWAGGIYRVEYDGHNAKIKVIENLQNFYLSKGKPFYIQSIYTSKKLFEKINGWDERIRFGEDVDMLRKIKKQGKLKFNERNPIKTSPRRFIKNKDYLYAILGGALALYGTKSLPFYPIRDSEKKETDKRIIFKKLLENYNIELKKSKNRLPLIIWIISKAVFIPIWIWVFAWIWQTAGLWALLPFSAVALLYQIADFWNQFLISKAVKDLKEIAGTKSDSEERKLFFEKIWQLETKRSPLTAVFYLLKRTGFKKVPNYSPQQELADIGPNWIGKHVGLALSLVYKIFYFFFHYHYRLGRMKFKGKRPKSLLPLRLPIEKELQKKGIFLGADIGCGDGQLMNTLALYCKQESWPAVFFGIEPKSDIIEAACQKMKKEGLVFKQNEKNISVDKLSELTKKRAEPVICFTESRLENLSQIFPPNSLDLIFLINTKHHLEDTWNKDGRKTIEKISKYWLILEEKRSWAPLIFIYMVGWIVSRIIVCEAEDSILSMYTQQEWNAQRIKTITTFPFLVWAMSDSLYELLQQERGVV